MRCAKRKGSQGAASCHFITYSLHVVPQPVVRCYFFISSSASPRPRNPQDSGLKAKRTRVRPVAVAYYELLLISY